MEFLNVLLSSNIKEDYYEYYDDNTIVKTMVKSLYYTNHDILNTSKNEVPAKYDKSGAFHYENYINLLYFYLLSHNQKPNSKNPYFEACYNFDNAKFIKLLFFKINTKQDAYIFSNLIYIKCNFSKNYKKRIDNILYNIINILGRSDNNEKIIYDNNNNRDNYNNGAYNIYNNNNNYIDLENDFPKINPKYILLIFKRFITWPSENKKIDEYRISSSLNYLFKLIEKYSKYYNYTIMLIDFIIELFTNNFNVMKDYISYITKTLKCLIQWLGNHPISPELYKIDGIFMYKDDNVAYKENITDEEKNKFNNEQIKKTEKRIQKLNNIIEKKIKEHDYDFEEDFDLTDFKFRKGDIIYYKNKKAIIKEFLDELILIKIIDKDKDKNENEGKNLYEKNDDKMSINDLEKIKFWVSKDDKNISIYSLE